MHRKILSIALPSIVSNITVPLLSLVDVSIAGHLGSPVYIGAVAVGGMIFNMAYWLFGFLRMGTSGMTSQALGSRDLDEVTRLLLRSLGVALLIAVGMLMLQYPIQHVAFRLIGPSDAVHEAAMRYFYICIWGAPAVLSLYSFSGWFIGMQNSRFPMYIAITQNVVNIAASLSFVFLLGMKVEGIALGTLLAQYAGTGMAVWLWMRHYGRLRRRWHWRDFANRRAMTRFFAVNRDIFLRTLCLVATTVFFTSTGARQGDIILAVNTLLMQLFTLFSYIMDGFAYAGEALGGRYYGAGNRTAFRHMVRSLFLWGIAMAAAFTLLYVIGGQGFLGLLTDEAEVIAASADYHYWTLAIPLVSFTAFLLDGIFIGTTSTRWMLWAIAIASACFFLIYWLGFNRLGNHALWLAFLVYLGMRGIMEAWLGRKLLW